MNYEKFLEGQQRLFFYWQSFAEFLRRRNCYAAFFNNLLRGCAPEEVVCVCMHLIIANPSDWVILAFVWDNTAEGCTYWERIHRLWVLQLKKDNEQL